MPDTRSTLRYPIDLPAKLKIGDSELSCRIRNLSLGGVFIVGPALPIGTRCKLRFSAPHVESFEGWCVARWTTDQGTGLQFESLRPIDTTQLASFIREASRPTQRMAAIDTLRPPARLRRASTMH